MLSEDIAAYYYQYCEPENKSGLLNACRTLAEEYGVTTRYAEIIGIYLASGQTDSAAYYLQYLQPKDSAYTYWFEQSYAYFQSKILHQQKASDEAYEELLELYDRKIEELQRDAGARTYAVLGCGFGTDYLRSNEDLREDIRTTGGALMADLAIAGGVALAKALRLLNSNALPPEVKQDEASATYVKKLKKTDGLIDWDRPVLEIERRIRAYNPWPCCYTFMPEKFRKRGTTGRTVILRAKVAKLDAAWKDAAPGTVVKIDKMGPVVRCHDTALQLLEVKPEGSSQMDGGSFCRGRQLAAGETQFLME
jgi:hypothetical protein